MRLSIEYLYIGDYDIPGDHRDARKATNMLAWRIRDLPTYRGSVMSVGTVTIGEQGEETDAIDVTLESDELIERWARQVRKLRDGEAFAKAEMILYHEPFVATLILSIRDGHLDRVHAEVEDTRGLDCDKVSEEIATLMPGRIIPDGWYALTELDDSLFDDFATDSAPDDVEF